MKIDGALVGTPLADVGSAAATLERQGFDGVLSFEGVNDPFLPLVLAAQQTTRLELTTGVAIAFARNPMVCAQMANDLQTISGGRFILGLGTQIRPHIEKRFSQTWSQPNARMREFVRAIRAIWNTWTTGERLDFRGTFYTHTLMTPFFNPGPNPHGMPKVVLAGFGPAMIAVAGEVADGWLVHPLNSPSYVQTVAMPALERGFARGGRSRDGFSIAVQTITMIGSTDEEIARARQMARAQIAFYGSTPAYKVMLDHHGWGDLQPVLHRFVREGRWGDMLPLITDEMLDVIGVSGRPADAGRKLRERNAFAGRTQLVLYNQTEPEAVTDLVAAYRG